MANAFEWDFSNGVDAPNFGSQSGPVVNFAKTGSSNDGRAPAFFGAASTGVSPLLLVGLGLVAAWMLTRKKGK